MPNVEQATIYFKVQRAKRPIARNEGVQVKDGMLTIYTIEPRPKHVTTKSWFGKGKTELVQGQEQVPIVSYPLSDIDKIDYGFMPMEVYMQRLEAEHKIALQKEKERQALEEERRKQTEPIDGKQTSHVKLEKAEDEKEG